jgi:hypothetical protein
MLLPTSLWRVSGHFADEASHLRHLPHRVPRGRWFERELTILPGRYVLRTRRRIAWHHWCTMSSEEWRVEGKKQRLQAPPIAAPLDGTGSQEVWVE